MQVAALISVRNLGVYSTPPRVKAVMNMVVAPQSRAASGWVSIFFTASAVSFSPASASLA